MLAFCAVPKPEQLPDRYRARFVAFCCSYRVGTAARNRAEEGFVYFVTIAKPEQLPDCFPLDPHVLAPQM